MDRPAHLFGIRHHGPGCARSLLQAFDALRPDCVLLEGPPEAEALVPHVLDAAMQPPVALLSHCPDDTQLAVFHPFAEFSPEWQALRWAATAGVPLRFIDLPLAHALALQQAERDAPAEPEAAPPAELLDTDDPLDALARAAGFGDGESWWNAMVEERGSGEQLFAAIAEAMTAVRAELGERHRSAAEAKREALREAHMRQAVRQAGKEGFERIAVVVGAWHLGGLRLATTAKADAALLKSLPKVKVLSTWVPWTHRRLARASGYGAGIASPGWYEHLWRSGTDGAKGGRAVGWLARVAALMRERDLDCSSAHLIEAVRLAESLAALRERPQPGLPELHEATRAVLTLGDDAVLHYIDDALVIGDRLGAVPPAVPTVPLQRDLEAQQKRLRLKPEALQRTLDLDLRQPNDLARSQLLHRLNLLDIDWGTATTVGRGARGTFHELWQLQWLPEFALRLIEASPWGATVAEAASARVAERCAALQDLPALSALVDRVLLADLPAAVSTATRALQDRAALSGDVPQLLAALPPLANVFRYGNVRQTDAALVAQVLDGLATRAAIGLPLAASALADEAAEALRETLLAAHAAIALRQAEEPTVAWRRALVQLAAQRRAHELLQGLAARLLLDDGLYTAEEAARALSLQLSSAAEPAKAAAWIDGFLNRNATVLLHDATVWQLVDDWLAGLGDEHFLRVLPLVRRTFALFGPGERRDLGERARRGAAPVVAAAAAPSWDAARAALPLPLLRELMGIPP